MKLLVFTTHGGAELRRSDRENAEILWSSDTDENFLDEFPDALDPNDDVEDIVDYLIDAEYLSEGEELDIDTEYLDGNESEEDEDE